MFCSKSIMPELLGTAKSISGFDPRSIPGCQLWFDAADSSSLTFTSTTTISTWNDKSSNGWHLTTVGSNQPGYSSNGFNGYPCITFTSGSNQDMRGPASGPVNFTNFFPINGGNTVFMVFSQTGGTCGGIWYQLTGSSSGGSYGIQAFGGNNLCWSTNTTNTAMSNALGPNMIVSWVNTLGPDYGSNTSSVSVYGAQLVASPPVTTSGYTWNYNEYFIIGAKDSNHNYRAFGNHAEYIVYNRALTLVQRQQVEGYLAWKWGFESGATSFIPTSISGCQLWLDGADQSSASMTLSGASVTAWKDKTGVSTTTLAGTAPTLSTNLPNQTGVYFPGTGYFTTSYTASPANETLFIVFNTNSVLYNAYSPLIGCSATGSRSYSLSNSYNSLGYVSEAIAWGSTTNFNIGTTTIAEGTYRGTTESVTVNGGTILTTASQSFTAGRTSIIAYSNGSYFKGWLYEIIAYNFALSTSQRQQVESYLANKWGVSVPTRVLAPPHPFSSITSLTRRFNPIDIVGLHIWLDGADSSTMTPSTSSSGTTTTAWLDKANNYSFTPTATQNATSNGTVYTVAGPTYVAGGGLNFNNPSGSLGNGQQGMGIYSSALNSSPLYTLPNQSMTIVIASYPNTNTIYRRIAYTGSYQLGGAYLPNFLLGPEMGAYEGGTLAYDYNGSAWAQLNYGSTGYNSNAVPRVDVMVSSPNASQWWWTNGTLNTFNISSNVYGSSYSNYPVNYFLLAAYTSTIDGNRNFSGIIYEVLFYSNALTTNERQAVEGYLAWKWNFASSLIAGHPYAKIPPSSVVPFYPMDISNCKIWLDGADQTSMTFSSGNLNTWLDKSGLDNTATAVGTITVSSNGAYFGGSSYMTVPGLLGVLANTPFVIFIVETFAGSVGYFFGDDSVNSGGATDSSLHVGYRSQTNHTFAFYADDLEDYNVSGSGIARIWSMWLPSGANRTTRRNGSTDVTHGNSNFLTQFSTPILGRVFGGNYYNGTISELIIYTGGLTLRQIQQVEGYLAWKWGLQNNLPTTHLCYKFPPSEQPYVNQSITTTGLILNLDPNTYISASGSWAPKIGNTWSVYNSPTVTTFYGNRILTFNGTNQYCYDPTGVNFQGAFSINIWINLAAISTQGNLLQETNGGYQWTDLYVTGSTLYAGTYQISNVSLGTAVQGAWQNICFTNSGAGTSTLACYKNGILYSTQSYTRQSPGANSYFYITGSSGNANYGYKAFSLGVMCFYTVALGAGDVRQNYNALCSRYGLPTI